MRRLERKHHMDGLLVLLLFGVFAVSVLAVLLSGAQGYRRLTERDDRAYDRRTAAQYVAARVRQAEGAVTVAPFGGVDALELREEIDGETYLTRVYCSEGSLRELFSAEEAELRPEDGQQVLPARAMEPRLENGLLTVTLTDGAGEQMELVLALRGTEEAAE